jgi:flavodoxin
MNAIVIYYSRTGTTKKIGEAIAKELDAVTEEVFDTVNRMGPMGYMRSGRDGMKRRLTKLKDLQNDLSAFDLVVIGTPIWGWNMTAPIRTLVTENKDKFKSVAFFCTMGGSGDDVAFKEMEDIIGKKPVSTLALTTVEVIKNSYEEMLSPFVSLLKTVSTNQKAPEGAS